VAEIERIVTGIPLWLMRDYIVDSGGTIDGEPAGAHENVETRIVGDRWIATLSPAPDQVVGSLRIGQVSLRLAGAADGVAALWTALEPRLVRAGG